MIQRKPRYIAEETKNYRSFWNSVSWYLTLPYSSQVLITFYYQSFVCQDTIPLITLRTLGRAECSYDIGAGGGAEELVFLESHQDKRNSTPATRKGKPNCHVQAMREAIPHGLRRPKLLPSTKETRTSSVPASHCRHHDTIQPASAIPKYTRYRISLAQSAARKTI
jgi:hypothetical protein